MGSKHTNVAIIDMGTNTFHLLVAEISSKPKILVREREAVKVGKGGINKNMITDEGFARALNTIGKFKTIIDQYSVRKTLAFGTSAIRNAANGHELIDAIRSKTGIEARIIDGEEEADLIYRGVRAALDLGQENSMIVDIGGGSVEFIIGNATGVQWKHSFEIGGQRLLEEFQKFDPIGKEDITNLERFLDQQLDPLKQQLKKYGPATMVGVSGTFDTLSEMFCMRNNLPYYPDDSETPFDINAFPSIYNDLLTHDRAGRLALPGMIEMRVDMIVVACVLVNFLVHLHDFKNIRVSSYSLKEGVLASLLP
ncbi:MAG TPA: exopolyphosphatase [Cyclobacteriaceae bacterium]|nr:exopolyphosphatase [Cyclobacteriaceae bacterium]